MVRRAPYDPIADDFPTLEQERQEAWRDTIDGVTMIVAVLLLIGMMVSTVVWLILLGSQWIKRWLVV